VSCQPRAPADFSNRKLYLSFFHYKYNFVVAVERNSSQEKARNLVANKKFWEEIIAYFAYKTY
jgi:hypothetical protein